MRRGAERTAHTSLQPCTCTLDMLFKHSTNCLIISAIIQVFIECAACVPLGKCGVRTLTEVGTAALRLAPAKACAASVNAMIG